MPGFDRTGPQGYGSRTGGGRGFCAQSSNAMGPRFIGRGRGRGLRQGARGFGAVRGRRWGFGTEMGYEVGLSEEKEILKADAESLKQELCGIEQRISELEKKSDETN
ncbi:DUF5320 domain-containing protein [Desulfosarcina sp.]|nr:DUF5320 domain-containing protein [Desulfosarcina sp.]